MPHTPKKAAFSPLTMSPPKCDEKGSSGCSMELVRAVLSNDEEGVLNLIDENVDVNGLDEKGTSPLHLAAFFGHDAIVGALLDAGARVDARDHLWITPLHRACIRNNYNVVLTLLERGANPRSQCKRFMTPLHLAAQHNATKSAELLLTYAPDVIDKTDWNGCTALHHASYYGNVEFVQLLLGREANINAKNKQGRMAVHWASMGAHMNVLRVLHENGAELNSRDSQSNTVLHYAAISGDVDLVHFILQNATMTVDCASVDGCTALHYAVNNGRSRVVETLLNNGADPNLTCGPQAFSALHLSAGSTEGTLCCELLLKAGCNIAQRSGDGSTALHYACEFGRIARTKMLVDRGAPVNAVNEEGISPLHVAARFGHDIIARFLIESGADLDLQTSDGETALHLAAYRGFLNVARALCENGCNIHLVDSNNRTALHVAAQSSNPNSEFVVECLLSVGIEPQARDLSGRSALHYAARNCVSSIIYKLMNAGAEVDVQDIYGFTPLHYAAALKNDSVFKCIKLMCRANDSSVQRSDVNGFLPIHYAVFADNVDVTMLLADVMNNISVPSSQMPLQMTLYHVAARYRHSQLLHKLLAFYHMRSLNLDKELAAKLNNTIGLEADANGRIPMHYAMSQGCRSCMEILLGTAIRKRALICKDNNGITPVHAAAARGSVECLTQAVGMLKPMDVNVLDKKSRRVPETSIMATLPDYWRTPMMFALGNGRWDCAEAMMASEKVDYSCVDSAGRGLMHRAVVMCDVKQCAELIKRGADFKTADCSKVTPLHLAAKTGNAGLVQLLMSQNADVTEDANGLSPFEWAAAGGNVAVLEILKNTRRRANMFISLLIAASCNRFNVCKYLLDELPECVSAVDARGWIALHYAARAGYVDIVQLLVERGAETSAIDGQLRTPLMLCTMCNDRVNSVGVAEILMAAGASVVLHDIDGNSALHLACMSRNEDVAQYILKHLDPPEPDHQAEHIVNSVNNRKETLLHLACKAGMVNFLTDVVVFSPYSIAVRDERGRVPVLAPIEDDDVAECASFLITILMDNPQTARTSLLCECLVT
uniref:Ion transport domain-containing protein n=1 Tax=Ascaris lumbricoides TaxID=6252 RepID=A0A9J2PCU4_ASCLU